jgi:hypothetical protein
MEKREVFFMVRTNVGELLIEMGKCRLKAMNNCQTSIFIHKTVFQLFQLEMEL